MDRVLERGVYRSSVFRALLGRAYASDTFEVSKKLK